MVLLVLVIVKILSVILKLILFPRLVNLYKNGRHATAHETFEGRFHYSFHIQSQTA